MIEPYQLICNKHLVGILLLWLLDLKRDDQCHVFLLSELFVDTDDLDLKGIFDGEMDVLKDYVVHGNRQVGR